MDLNCILFNINIITIVIIVFKSSLYSHSTSQIYRTYKKREEKKAMKFENPAVNLPYIFEELVINEFIISKLTSDE
jgi:hypothetical protein